MTRFDINVHIKLEKSPPSFYMGVLTSPWNVLLPSIQPKGVVLHFQSQTSMGFKMFLGALVMWELSSLKLIIIIIIIIDSCIDHLSHMFKSALWTGTSLNCIHQRLF